MTGAYLALAQWVDDAITEFRQALHPQFLIMPTLHEAILPVFSDDQWPDIIPAEGFVWALSPHIDLTDKLEPLVREVLFDNQVVELLVRPQLVDLNLSFPAKEFLHVAASRFNHGINLIHSQQREPPSLHWQEIPTDDWPRLMQRHEVNFFLHRPDGGERSKVWSIHEKLLSRMVERCQ